MLSKDGAFSSGDREIPYGLTRRFRGATFTERKGAITEALQREGFGILTEIDVQATLKKKLGVDTKPYIILGACNPTLAHRALSQEPGIGLLLPCNVVVWQEDDAVVVSIARPTSMFTVVADARVEPIAAEAEERLARALEGLEDGRVPERADRGG